MGHPRSLVIPIARSFKAYFYIQNLKNYPLTWKQG